MQRCDLSPSVFRRVLLFLTLASLTSVAQTQTPQKRTLTPEDVVNIRGVSDANISPDGKRIAFVVTEPADPNKPEKSPDDNIWIVPSDGSEPARLFAASPKSENFPRWSPDGHWLAFLSDRGEDGQPQIWLMRADGGEAEKLTEAKAGVSSFSWSPDGRMIAFLARDAATDEEQKKQNRRDDAIEVEHSYHYTRLWIIGLNDRKAALVTRQNLDVKDFDWSPDGESFAVAYTATPRLFEDLQSTLAVVRQSDGELLRTLSEDVNIIFTQNVCWSPDGSTVLFFESSPTKGAYWVSLVDAKGGPARPLLKEYPATFWSCEWAPDSRHVITEAAVGTRVKLLEIDARSGEVTPLADILNGQGNFAASHDGRTLAFVGEKADSPGDVWSLAVGQSPRQLTNFNPQIAAVRLGNVREISWTNRKDGHALHGVLVTPPDFKSGQLYPTIVEAHPGNTAWWAGWQASWWQWAELLASNGYVVFLPNPRGVMGRGWEFAELSQTWDDVAFDDTMDGVDSLIEQKLADPNRLGIGGWSNGGYMTTRVITHTDRFKAAVPFAAPLDFPIWWATSPIREYLEQAYGAAPLRGRQQYEAHSPFYSVQNCKTPTLILQGDADPMVPSSQAYEFYYSLKSLGVETEMVVYPREGHTINERAHQVDFQRRMLAWFDKHLK
jgi:dipeptidyl aminopeptidase/acylaminoacyl peptidase